MSLVDELTQTLSPGSVLTSEDTCASYLTDWRRIYHGRALCVVRPGSTEEVAQTVKVAARHRVGVVPQGGNTGLAGGSIPSGAGDLILVSLERMNRIRSIDPANYTMTVEAGCILNNVQEAAAAADRLFPLSLSAEGSCQIGGNLSTNAGGTAVLRYGNMRELTLGLEVVLPDGRIWNGLRSLRKDNTGYDLKQLFIGAEGTLGIITAAVLKLFPLPRFRSTAFVAIGSLEAALDLLSRLRQDADDTLTTLEMIPSVALELSVSHVASCSRPLEGQHDYYLLIELAGGKTEADLRTDLESILERALSDGLIEDAVIAQSTSDAARLWAIREGIVEAQRHLGASIKHDVAVPVSAVPEFFRHASSLVQARLPGIIVYAFGHLGDGNLHFNLIQPGDMDASEFLARTGDFNRCIHDVVHQYGGTISAEHGIGQLRREEMPRYKSALELELMRVVKNALDPDGRMNPGKLLRAD